MKIAICDDDALSLQRVTDIVNEFAAGKGILVYSYSLSAKLLEDALQLGGFDLYILDILMVSTDLVLTARNKFLDRKADKEAAKK